MGQFEFRNPFRATAVKISHALALERKTRRARQRPVWESRRTLLQSRLEDLLVFELSLDGHREYRTMTLRELYNYVLAAVATKPTHLKTGTLATHESIRASKNHASLRLHSSSFEPNKSPMFGPREPTTTISEESHDSPTAPPVLHLHLHKEQQPINLDSNRRRPPPEIHPKTETSANETPSNISGQPPSGSFLRSSKSLSNRSRATAGPPPWTQPITYRERLGGYLHPRDMRRLVTPFSSSNEPEVIVRRHVILLNFDPLRAIVLRDRLLVLVPDGADQILETLAKRLKGGMHGMEASVFGDEQQSSSAEDSNHPASVPAPPSASPSPPFSALANEIARQTAEVAAKNSTHLHESVLRTPFSIARNKNDAPQRTSVVSPVRKHESNETESDSEDAFTNDEWDDLKGKGWIDLPFELQSVDAVLHTVSSMLTDEANDLQEYTIKEIEYLLHAGKAVTSEHGHDILRYIKGDISEMVGRCQGFIRAINVLLDDDEDLALMNLSRLITHPERFIQPVPDDILHEESDEPELILEAYLQQSNSNTNVLELLRQQVATAEELMIMKSDAVRNRLLYINTLVSLLTLAMGTGAFIGSIFGMNLYSGLEDSPTAFLNVIIGTVVGVFILTIIFAYQFFKAEALPVL